MPLPQNTYLEFCLTSRSPSRATIPFLFFKQAGIAAADIVQTEFKTFTRWAYFTRSRSKIRSLSRRYARLKPAGLKAGVRRLGKRDWLLRWQDYFHAMPLGRRFTVVPVWERKNSAARTAIYLDPCGAFGSGAHETTRLMVAMMETLAGRFKSFLDIGTGTGILAVVARKLGAATVTGLDLDGPSVSAAKKNFRQNNEAGGHFVCADILAFKRRVFYDLVAANFISADLIRCRRAIVAHVEKGGWLLVSGISLKNLPGFLRDFRPPSFHRVRILRSRSWAAVLYQRHF